MAEPIEDEEEWIYRIIIGRSSDSTANQGGNLVWVRTADMM